jgi:hypothetical protein
MKNPTDSHTITPAQLEAKMIHHLASSGWTAREIAAYLTAQASHGVLRENCPDWMQRAAGFIIDRASPFPIAALESLAGRVQAIAAADTSPKRKPAPLRER